MNPTSAVVLTGTITAAGTWAQDKQISIRTFVGTGVLAIILAAMGEVSPELASQFGLLIVVAAALYYTIPIAKGLGYTR